MNFRDKKIFILLGRTGDILNLLPAIEYEAKQKNYKPRIMVAKEYGGILEGCTYLEPIVYDGDFRNINHAVRVAQSKYPGERIVNCAVYGKNYKLERKTSSFTKEIWRLSGCEKAQIELPLNFDNRDKVRESIVLDELPPQRKLGEEKKKIVLIAGSGNSSPLANAENIFRYIQIELEKVGIVVVDISKYKAERFYDLLGLYEKAFALIAIDSAPLHLANAVPNLPVISLISDLKDEWHRSGWRPNHLLRVLYSEVPGKLEDIIQAAKQGHMYLFKKKIRLVTTFKKLTGEPGETCRRYEFSSQNRAHVNKINNFVFYEYHKFTEDDRVPKVKALIDYAAKQADTFDILAISNADICFNPDIVGMILHETERHEAVYSHRRDFDKLTKPLNTEAEISRGKWYCGSDLFAFTLEWWQKHKDIFPDMYFAREFWDMIMRNMIKRSGGVEIHNAIYHEKHPSFWEAKENRSCAENLHNKSLARQWFDTYGGDWNDWKYPLGKLNYKFPHGADNQ